MKLLLCNVSWMKHYAGPTPDDMPQHGGEYVREQGYGHEAINFQPYNGRDYGFVQLRHGTINISRLDPSADDKVDNVLVVWRARSRRGSVVVGWYKHAVVYRELQSEIPGRFFRYHERRITPRWIITARQQDAFLVPRQHRSFKVPVSHKGFGSQTFVSFLDSDLREVTAFKKRLLVYIERAESGDYQVPKPGKRQPVDQILKLKIERAAIDAVSSYYRDLGYGVRSVERENVGYDLEACHKSETLLIEVKGTSHRSVGATVNLSPNEYRKSKARRRQYRICIVTDVLASAQVHDFIWDKMEEAWRDEITGRSLSVHEVMSANLTIT